MAFGGSEPSDATKCAWVRKSPEGFIQSTRLEQSPRVSEMPF